MQPRNLARLAGPQSPAKRAGFQKMKTESEGDEKLQALNCWEEEAEITVNPKRLFETMKAEVFWLSEPVLKGR